MRVGVPTERKAFETRVAVTPDLAAALTGGGHEVLVQSGAGLLSGIEDADFAGAGATLVPDAASVWSRSDLIVKVKEPIAGEYPLLRPEHAVFSYLHLAASGDCLAALLESGCTGIAFETVQSADGTLPLLAPMSAIAGRLAVQFGADYLTAPRGGKGVLLGGVAGVRPGSVVVIGAGTAGQHATSVALGLQANVTVINLTPPRLTQLAARYPGQLTTLAASDRTAVELSVAHADLVVCAALVPGARAPIVVTEAMVGRMARGSVLIDISVDQGGNFELSRPTSHGAPTFEVHGVLVSCITNLPAAVPRSATFALSAAITPYVLQLADLGVRAATDQDPSLRKGINVADGRIVHPALLDLPAA